MHLLTRIFSVGRRPVLAAALLAGWLGPLSCAGSSWAQEAGGTPPPLQPVETPTPKPAPRVPLPEPAPETPVPTPAPTPKVRAPKPPSTPGPEEPVAVVNGSPVYRPLFRSVVADPVDRALILQDYRHRGLALPADALEQATRNHTKSAFGDQNHLIEKLHEAGASFDDYRAFVAEEVKLNAMLSLVSKNARAETDRKALRENWLGELRKKASINKPKKT